VWNCLSHDFAFFCFVGDALELTVSMFFGGTVSGGTAFGAAAASLVALTPASVGSFAVAATALLFAFGGSLNSLILYLTMPRMRSSMNLGSHSVSSYCAQGSRRYQVSTSREAMVPNEAAYLLNSLD
jgi:hypothetical protein